MLSAAFATLSAAGIQAALIGNLAHGVITGLLFFLVGAIKERAGTGDLTRLGGLRESSPPLAGLLGFAAVASLGLPGLAVATGLEGAVPVGVQLVAGRYREDLLLAAGEAIEAGGTPPSPVDPRM